MIIEDDPYGFGRKTYHDLMEFYAPFFKSSCEEEAFIDAVYLRDKSNRIPWQMINQIQRFVTLAKDIDLIRPGRDGLRILFIKTCLESLNKLSSQAKGSKDFYEKFAKCFSEKGQEYILSSISHIDYTSVLFEKEFCNHVKLDMGVFLNIIKAIRNRVVHDGVFWETKLFSDDEDSIWISEFESDKSIVKNPIGTKKKDENWVYSFQTRMSFEQFSFFLLKLA